MNEGLQLSELSSETMQYAQELIERHSKPSRHDCFALALARQENCPLLTGDGNLRKAVDKEGVSVMGTIWIIGQMVKQCWITVSQAEQAYQSMEAAGRRLPWDIAYKELAEIQSDLK